jgi:hypothetical protein
MQKFIYSLFFVVSVCLSASDDYTSRLLKEAKRDDSMKLKLVLEKSQAFEGEPVRVFVEWISKLPLNSFRNVELMVPFYDHPKLLVFDEPLIDSKNPKSIGMPVTRRRLIAKVEEIQLEGQPHTRIQFKLVIIPKSEGFIQFKDAWIVGSYDPKKKYNNNRRYRAQYPSYFNNNFFDKEDSGSNYERIYSTADSSSLEVLALPLAGKPKNFSGIVGSFSMLATLSETSVSVGDPIGLNVKMSDYSFLPALKLPRLSSYLGFSAQFSFPEKDADRELSKNHISFNRTLRPVSSSVISVPPLRVSYFDPTTLSYGFVETPEIPISVKESEKVTIADLEFSDVNQKNYLRKNTNGIWGIEIKPDGNFPLKADKPSIWLLVSPFIVFILVFILSIHYRLKRWHPKDYRKKFAKKWFLKSISEANTLEAVENVFRDYIYNFYGLNAKAHSLEDLKGLISEEDWPQFHKVYDSLESYFYGKDQIELKPEDVKTMLMKCLSTKNTRGL